MRCPVCLPAVTASEVTPSTWTMSTALGFSPYYDTEGIYHSHDPNFHTKEYRCSLGHRWSTTRKLACPAKGCERKGSEETKVLEPKGWTSP